MLLSERYPSCLPLALDVRFGGFSLRVQRIEVLLQTLFGRFARIYRAA
jgi:hypothetical protein